MDSMQYALHTRVTPRDKWKNLYTQLEVARKQQTYCYSSPWVFPSSLTVYIALRPIASSVKATPAQSMKKPSLELQLQLHVFLDNGNQDNDKQGVPATTSDSSFHSHIISLAIGKHKNRMWHEQSEDQQSYKPHGAIHFFALGSLTQSGSYSKLLACRAVAAWNLAAYLSKFKRSDAGSCVSKSVRTLV